MKYFLIIVLIAPTLLRSQSLSPDRVKKIKSATVRVLVEGDISIGSAFFINDKGAMLTCWHVTEPALKYNKKIFIEFNNGDTIEVGVPRVFVTDTLLNRLSFAYDFCTLIPVRPIIRGFTFLNLGDFNTAAEGDEIYTCGYPLGYPKQFISKGMVSTKYINQNIEVTQMGKKYTMPRQEALLDMTLNRGNSGGAIIKIGKTIEEDRVIGIADFIINPIGNWADSIISSALPIVGSFLMNGQLDSTGKVIGGFDQTNVTIAITKALKSMSIGVSGCVSINHFTDALKSQNK